MVRCGNRGSRGTAPAAPTVRPPRGLGLLTHRFCRGAWLPSGRGQQRRELRYQADRARDACQWERPSRFYLDAHERDPDNPAIWVELGRALKEAGRDLEAQFVERVATALRVLPAGNTGCGGTM
jgi:hypothetical protein